jgi:prolipoprotein diacylglyceryltransferase
LTFYGGLICAALAIWYYARKHGIGFWYLNDAAAPGLMLAYAVGRIGCQVSGDGDWGILNSAYITNSAGKSVLAQPGEFEKTLSTFKDFYQSQLHSIHSVDSIPQHLAVKAPGGLPDWLFAYAYPHNVVGEGIRIANCDGPYCSQLPIPVFPTPFYETLVCLGLFFFLWSIRKKISIPGRLFAIYLIVNGLERFFVEKIRVNTKYDFLGIHPTQAEIISFLLVVSGAVLFFTLKPKPPGIASPTSRPS